MITPKHVLSVVVVKVFLISPLISDPFTRHGLTVSRGQLCKTDGLIHVQWFYLIVRSIFVSLRNVTYGPVAGGRFSPVHRLRCSVWLLVLSVFRWGHQLKHLEMAHFWPRHHTNFSAAIDLGVQLPHHNTKCMTHNFLFPSGSWLWILPMRVSAPFLCLDTADRWGCFNHNPQKHPACWLEVSTVLTTAGLLCVFLHKISVNNVDAAYATPENTVITFASIISYFLQAAVEAFYCQWMCVVFNWNHWFLFF